MVFLQKIKKIAVPITGITRLLDVWFSFFSILEDIRIAFDVCERKKEDQVGFECISNTH